MTPILAADWLTISINLLLVIHVIVCLLLALVVLMQRPKQEGLGAAFGGGLTDQAFGAQTTNVLQKGTVYLGTLFFVITLVLAILIGKRQASDPSLTESDKPKEEESASPASDALEGEKSDIVVPGEENGEDVPETPSTEPGSDPVPEDGEEADAPAEGSALGSATGAIIGEEPEKEEPKEAPATGGDQ